MKIAIRTLIVLAAALAVAGALYALNQAGLLADLLPAGAGGARPAFDPAGAGAVGGGHHEEGGMRAAVEILKSLAVVAVGVVALWPARRLLYGRRRARAATA